MQKIARFDPNKILKKTIKLFKEQAKMHNVKITSSVKSYLPKPFEDMDEGKYDLSQQIINSSAPFLDFFKLPCMFGDKIRLQQVLINLIKNALKHTNNGTISIKTAFNFVENLLVVQVRDSGRGISHQDLTRLFTRFGKLDDPMNMNCEGVGLGLSICESIIRVNEGQIQITSDGINKGTLATFSMKMTSIAHDEVSEASMLESTHNSEAQSELLKAHTSRPMTP